MSSVPASSSPASPAGPVPRPPPGAFGSCWRPAVLAAVALAACLSYAALARTASDGGLPLDDGWIHLTFARSLAAGEGMSYRDGQWVSGSTAPLWTALLALGFLLPAGAGAPLLWAKLLGTACYVAACLATVRLGATLGLRAGFAWLAGLLLALTDWMVWGALSGMEIPLFVLLTTWGLELQARPSQGRATAGAGWALPVLGLASLVRPEGLLLLGLAVADGSLRLEPRAGGELEVSLRRARSLVRPLLVALLALAPFALFSWLAGGSALPTTFDAKLEGGFKWRPALRDLWLAAEILFRPQPWAFLLAGAGAASLVRRAARRRAGSVLPLLWLLLLPCAYSMLAPAGRPMPVGNFGRYLFPLYPALIVLGMLGAQSLGRAARVPWRWRGSRLPVPQAAVALLLLPSLAATLGGASRYARNVANVEESDVRAGRWIAAHVPPEAPLGVQDVGAIGYLAPNPLVDLVGIVTPEILARSPHGGPPLARGLRGLAEAVRARDVELLVVFPESYGGEEMLARFFPGLRAVQRFPIADNITMAGRELVIYALPGA
ncbi:MAG TPA: hypothetical protein VMV46_21955 [Thermoanaerobaculia bacterium]|nr:hypothetical protein [Thermoanaerobaculia bacterium]